MNSLDVYCNEFIIIHHACIGDRTLYTGQYYCLPTYAVSAKHSRHFSPRDLTPLKVRSRRH